MNKQRVLFGDLGQQHDDQLLQGGHANGDVFLGIVRRQVIHGGDGQAIPQMESTRPVGPAPQRCITVVLTDHVPGIEFLPLRHPDRLRVVWNRPLGRVVRAVLGRIGRAPGDLQAAHWGDDPALFGPVSGEPSGEAAPRPLAVFWDGATVDQLTTALADLAAANPFATTQTATGALP